MEILSIEATKYTPAITSSLDSCSISFVGKSYPENTFEFYEPVEAYIGTFLELFKQNTVTINFDIDYFNSSTSKIFFNIFDMLEEAVNDGQKIVINWLHDKEDETMKEAGEDFAEDFAVLKFNINPKN
jgi:hypothetical protein